MLSAYQNKPISADAGKLPSEAIMVSDEIDPDLIGAQKLGIRSVLLDTPYVKQDPFEGSTIRSLDELLDLL